MCGNSRANFKVLHDRPPKGGVFREIIKDLCTSLVWRGMIFGQWTNVQGSLDPVNSFPLCTVLRRLVCHHRVHFTSRNGGREGFASLQNHGSTQKRAAPCRSHYVHHEHDADAMDQPLGYSSIASPKRHSNTSRSHTLQIPWLYDGVNHQQCTQCSLWFSFAYKQRWPNDQLHIEQKELTHLHKVLYPFAHILGTANQLSHVSPLPPPV